jgi:hypothetical protein
MKNVIDIINDAILDVCANPLVENGTFDPNNNEHMFLLMETLDGNLEEEHIVKAVSALKCEGKYPDRQAYNKEGWLVTFPSKEYRDAAIKRNTHSLSDPTHGKGGMNLYYKKRGKQKRMTQQAQSGVGSTGQQQLPPAEAPLTQQPAPKKAPIQAPQAPQEKPQDVVTKTPQKGASADIEPEDSSLPTTGLADQPKSTGIAPAQKPESLPPSAEPEQEKPQSPPQTPTVAYKDITEKFATSKGWESTPYGEWRDKSGDTVAVVSLSGEVTPIKSNDREELKLFAEKQK